MSSRRGSAAALTTGALFIAAAIFGGLLLLGLLGAMLGMTTFTSFGGGILSFVTVIGPPSLLLVAGVRTIFPGAGRGVTAVVVTAPVCILTILPLGRWAIPYVLPAFTISTLLAFLVRPPNVIALLGALPIAGFFGLSVAYSLRPGGGSWATAWIGVLNWLAAICGGASVFLASRKLARKIRHGRTGGA